MNLRTGGGGRDQIRDQDATRQSGAGGMDETSSRGERDEWCQGRRIGRDEAGFALLITRRWQVQILPPLPTSSQVRGPFPLGEGLLHVWPVTRSVSRLLTSDVSVVPLRLRRNAELRFVGHIATGRDTWDAVAGSKPRSRTWDLAVRALSATLKL